MILLTAGETYDRMFGLDWQLLADSSLTLIAVFVLFLCMSYFLFNPARKMLNDRKNKIQGELEENRIVEEARQEAARIMERARTEAALEKQKLADEVKREIISVASLMAGKVVAVSIDAGEQERLMEETLKEMGENTWLS